MGRERRHDLVTWPAMVETGEKERIQKMREKVSDVMASRIFPGLQFFRLDQPHLNPIIFFIDLLYLYSTLSLQ